MNFFCWSIFLSLVKLGHRSNFLPGYNLLLGACDKDVRTTVVLQEGVAQRQAITWTEVVAEERQRKTEWLSPLVSYDSNVGSGNPTFVSSTKSMETHAKADLMVPSPNNAIQFHVRQSTCKIGSMTLQSQRQGRSCSIDSLRDRHPSDQQKSTMRSERRAQSEKGKAKSKKEKARIYGPMITSNV